MRTLLKFTGEVTRVNKAMLDGTLGPTLGKLAEQIQPEFSFFATENGQRTAYYIFDMKDPADVAAISEPLFLAFDAKVEFKPVMSAEDLQRGLKAVAETQ